MAEQVHKKTNDKCLKCSQECKQYSWLEILVDPYFEANDKNSSQ